MLKLAIKLSSPRDIPQFQLALTLETQTIKVIIKREITKVPLSTQIVRIGLLKMTMKARAQLLKDLSQALSLLNMESSATMI